MFKRALRLAAWPVLISLFITPVRVFLELAGVPTVFVFPLGLLWLALGFSIFLGTRLVKEDHPYLLLLLSLVIFSPPSRFPIIVVLLQQSKGGGLAGSFGGAGAGEAFFGARGVMTILHKATIILGPV